MDIRIINRETLTFDSVIRHRKELYAVSVHDGEPVMEPISLDNMGENSCILRICMAEEKPVDMSTETLEEPKPAKTPGRSYSGTVRRRSNLTYKLFSSDETESIFVEFRPANSGIRVSFKDKESAGAYFEYFRDQFYKTANGPDFISVSSIYKDLNIVNWKPEDCDNWGWPTLDHGPCHYISGVTKNQNAKRYGFTLSRPRELTKEGTVN